MIVGRPFRIDKFKRASEGAREPRKIMGPHEVQNSEDYLGRELIEEVCFRLPLGRHVEGLVTASRAAPGKCKKDTKLTQCEDEAIKRSA